jgi:hypothetical protein
MKSEKNELLKSFRTVINDLMDHYEEYTDDEKAQIGEIFRKVAELNAIMDKYDVAASANWTEYCALVSRHFTAAH